MKRSQHLGWGLALLMLTERLWKLQVVTRFFQQPQPTISKPTQLISILQPILSGDPTLPHSLERSLQLRSSTRLEYIWLVDSDDREGQRICQELIARYPQRDVQLVLLPPVPMEYNPKIFKLVEGRKRAQGDVICVLDDDTLLPDDGLDLCLPYLDQPGVGLAFGLPYYINFSNFWSSMVSTYVDSNSLLTYVPYITLTKPFTINGMFYMMRSTILDSIGGFDAIKPMLADDFAIAQLVLSHGYTLTQTPLRHGISTQVQNARHYFSLLQRWFIFPRESILRHVSWPDRLLVCTVALLPSLYPLALLLSLLLKPSWSKLISLLLYFGCNTAIVAYLNRRYLDQALPNKKIWLVPLMMIVAPIQILVALCSPQRVNWRGHIVQIERGGGFSYVRQRGKTSS